ncbi:MAG: hypothetical protein JRK53_25920 [Deltaproteobacteria bacterium]|nr:hypothetical protein [Deltaproteobacteria bacterium]
MAETMTPRERFMAALQLQPHERVPLANSLGTVMQWDLAELDYTWEELFNDSDKLVYLEERCIVEYGNDSLVVPRDVRSEALGFGSRVVYNLPCGRGFRLPMVAEWVVSSEKDLSKLRPYDPKKIPAMTLNLEVVARLREKFPDVAIIGLVNGIGSLHTDVVNDQNKFSGDSHGHFKTLLDNIAKNPKFVHQVLERHTTYGAPA